MQTPGSLFPFQGPSDTCLDWREQFLQVVQEAFAKEREMLAAGLQPRLCGCDPGAPSALSQNLEKVAPEQVSLGLVSPSAPGVTWPSFQVWHHVFLPEFPAAKSPVPPCSTLQSSLELTGFPSEVKAFPSFLGRGVGAEPRVEGCRPCGALGSCCTCSCERGRKSRRRR